MDAIEKRARELYEAARGLYNATIADPEVIVRCNSGEGRVAVTAAADRCFRALNDFHACTVSADDLQVVAASADGANEVHSEAVDRGQHLVEPREGLAAVNALEHGAGLRLGGDGGVAADHIADERKLVERVAMAQQASEQAQTGWTWADCSPIEVEGWMDLARAAIAALTPPEGYVLVQEAQLRHLLSDAITSVEFIAGRGQSKPLSRRVSDQAWALVELIPARRKVP
ncbi:hypothetical protein ACFQ6N_40135 [Kitasatospora sp. NPDC056446]|uniref:hypothetical protein n=1 Tax=Kitasatospora sp. NPDC056446 TaxID=3345819 RepID=UPI0036A05169